MRRAGFGWSVPLGGVVLLRRFLLTRAVNVSVYDRHRFQRKGWFRNDCIQIYKHESAYWYFTVWNGLPVHTPAIPRIYKIGNPLSTDS
jgi:hypothetical protein